MKDLMAHSIECNCTGGGSAKYPSAPRKSDLAVTSSGNSRKTISAPRVNINPSDENASNGSDLDNGNRDLPKKKKKVQDGTEGVGGVGNRGLGGDGNEAVSASGDNSSKAVQKLTYSSAENQKGLGKRAKGKVGHPFMNCLKVSPGRYGDNKVDQEQESWPCDASCQGARWSQERALRIKG